MSAKRASIPGSLWASLALTAVIAAGFGACTSASTTPGAVAEKIFSTTTDNAHFHMVTIAQGDIEGSPSLGIAQSTTAADQHTHTFSLTGTQLETVAAGQPVTVTTSISDVTGPHSHNLTVMKWF